MILNLDIVSHFEFRASYLLDDLFYSTNIIYLMKIKIKTLKIYNYAFSQKKQKDYQRYLVGYERAYHIKYGYIFRRVFVLNLKTFKRDDVSHTLLRSHHL